MDDFAEDVLRQIEWPGGLHIPVANEENKLLQKEFQQRMQKKEYLSKLCESIKNNVNSLKEYGKNVREQKAENQKLVSAYRKQLECEEDELTEAYHENEKMVHITRNMKKKRKQETERNQQLQAELNKIMTRAKKLQTNVEWSSQLLQLWNECIAQQSDELDVFKNYKIQDEKKFSEIETKRKRLLCETEKYKEKIQRKCEKISLLKCELENASKIRIKLREERNKLITRWESAISLLKSRDDEIQNTMQEITILEEVTQDTRKKFEEQKAFYDEQMKENTQLESELKELRKNIAQIQMENCDISETVQKCSDKVLDMEKELSDTEWKVKQERIIVESLDTKIKDETAEKDALLKEQADLQAKIRDTENDTISTSNETKRLNDMYEEKVKVLERSKRKRDKLKRNIEDTRNAVSRIEAQINSEKADMKRLADTNMNLDKCIIDNKKVLEEEEKSVAEINSKLKILSAKIVDIEKDKAENEDKLNAEQRLKETKEKNKKLLNDYNELTVQVKQVDAEINTLNSDLSKLKESVAETENRQNELTLEIEAGERHLEKLRKEIDEKQMEENILRLKIDQLENKVNKETGKIYDLEKQELELEMAIKDKKSEIDSVKAVLIVRKRTLLREQSDIKKNIECLNLRIGQLMKKYQVIVDSLGSTDDGTAYDITKYRIEMVKKRAELLEKGDELDVSINKMEKDIQALEKTRDLINSANQQYRKDNLHVNDITESEQEELENVENECSQLNELTKKQETELSNLKNTYRVIEEALSQHKQELDKLEGIKKEKGAQAMNLKSYVDDQEKKIRKLQKNLNSLKKSAKSWKMPFSSEYIMKDIDIRMMQEMNKKVLQNLSEMAAEHLEVGPVIKHYLTEKGIPISSSSIYHRAKRPESNSPRLSVSSKSSAVSLKNKSPAGSYVAPSVVNIDSSVFGAKT